MPSVPPLVLSVDDVCYYEYMKGNVSGWDLNAVPNLKLGER